MALKLLRKSADQGWFQAQYDLGGCYEFALEGLSKDLGQAKHWYQLSADQGFASAQYALNRVKDATASSGGNAGANSSNGNPAGSSPTLEQAMANGDYYADSANGHFDFDKAILNYKYAAGLGSVDAKVKLGDLYDAQCDGGLIGGDKQYCPQALYWFQLAANQGNGHAREKANEYRQSGWR